jgi:cyanophycin synthetase
MKTSRIRALRGPNLWNRSTAIEAVVTCSGNESDLSLMPEFIDRLRQRFPDIGALPEPTAQGVVSMAHALELTTLALQTHAGCQVAFSRTAEAPEAGVFQVVVEYTEEEVGRLALELAQSLIHSAIDDTPFDTAQTIATLRALDEAVRMGPSTAAIVDAAIARGIPYRRLTKGSLVQLGWGCKQRRIQAAEVDATSAIAEEIAQDKELTKRLLHAAGIPVPRGKVVDSPEQAWEVACELGGPVVVKPRDGNQGKGVTVNAQTREQVINGYHTARSFRSEVIVERYLPGIDYRVLVVGNQLVAAARREPPLVIGDGQHTVLQLVEQINADPRRGDGHATPLTKIPIDDIAIDRLAEQGLTPESVPALGMRVVLRNNANLSTGGTATDVTDEVHRDVAARAIAAARMVGLDICGIDIVCENINTPLEVQHGGIVEVNAAPGLRMHLTPSFGKSRNVGEAVINHMFSKDDDGRIPVVAVTGTNGKTTTVRLIAHLMKTQGFKVGMTNTDGVYVDGEQIDSGDCSGPRSARNVLIHPDVEAAVFETARGGMLREGLAYDRCHVAVVTNVGTGDHLGLNFITTVQDLRVLKRVVVLNVAPNGMAVLNGADPNVASMAKHCPGAVTFFGPNEHHPVIATHRALGKRVIFVRDHVIVAAEGDEETELSLAEIPLTHAGALQFQVENVMAAIGAAWALGFSWALIRASLKTFLSDAESVPGRFNLFDYQGASVIADYGHNPDAIHALCASVMTMPANRRMVVISGAGDRQDKDIAEQARLLGGVFDHVIFYEDACQRSRSDGEVIGILRSGLQGATQTKTVQEVRGEFLAIDTALTQLRPGDLCLILIDQVREALAHIKKRVDEACVLSARS